MLRSLRSTEDCRQIRLLHEALAELATRWEDVFHHLFTPAGTTYRVDANPASLFATLREWGLVEGSDSTVEGRHRIRRIDDRFYVLDLGVEGEYHQDVWPETDVLLDVLSARPQPGRLADIGTGCGIIGIEAARQGYQVVATDLYESALELSRFNAELNGVTGIDFRRGHLCEPLGNEFFDLILTCPHYGRLYDQLRLEVLLSGVKHLRPGGRLVLGTVLEWQDEGPPAVTPLLGNLIAGAEVAVAPLRGTFKRDWFRRARSSGPIAPLVSRHRFTVSVTAAQAEAATRQSSVRVQMPTEEETVPEHFVPLRRLLHGEGRNATAVIAEREDLERLRLLLETLAVPDAVFTTPLPGALLDACRFAARPCLGPQGGARAILDLTGGIRLCTHGQQIGRASDSYAALVARIAALKAAAELRRGCDACPAQKVCSRCLSPGPQSEADYCDLIRRHAAELPLLHRLLQTWAKLENEENIDLTGPLSVRRWPRQGSIPIALAQPETPPEAVLYPLSQLWNQRETWIIKTAGQHYLFYRFDGKLRHGRIAAELAEFGARIACGARLPELDAYCQSVHWPPRMRSRWIANLTSLLS